MKVVILAGGLGTRLGEETTLKPKPMVAIGGYPILWHIMKIYSYYGFNDFIILTGYKQDVIKNYFVNYYMNNCDVTVDLTTNAVEVHQNRCEPFKVTMLYTGRDTMTGGRINRAKEYLKDEPFMLTYGDGVSDVNIHGLIENHKKSGKIVTLTAVQPQGRFGALEISENGLVDHFQEKPKGDGVWINGGFMVCQPEVFKYIPDDDSMPFERFPLQTLAKMKQLNSYRHYGFWRPMDMLKDKQDLNQMWADKKAPWKVWKD